MTSGSIARYTTSSNILAGSRAAAAMRKRMSAAPVAFTPILRTAWLPAEVDRDPYGFLYTGAEAAACDSWKLPRSPHPHETTVPGLFAVGDVRSGSVKRVASAVGEGSVVVSEIHQFLAAPRD